MRLVLASASPRRADLLRAAGFEFEALAVDLDERIRAGETAEEYVRRLAMEKSARAMEMLNPGLANAGDRSPAKSGHYVQDSPVPDSLVCSDVVSGFSRTRITIVLGADTAVVIDGRILGKPRDDDDAAAMLRQLSGRAHEVMTGVSVRSGTLEAGRVVATAVEFSPLTEADIEWYVGSGEGRDKAGAYGIQGLASRFIPRIQGSYANVVGLPVTAVQELIAEIASNPLSGYPK
jgi:septum formation protein